MDFPLYLTIAVALCGAIWLADIVLFSRRRQAARSLAEQQGVTDEEVLGGLTRESWPIEYAKSFFPVLFIVFFLRSFIVEPFQIPSGSMLPTLEIGDFILVNKFSYGIRLPVLNTKVIEVGEPKRGDVMVFRYPGDPKINYIKRVIGVPGDKIAYYHKRLYVNGQEVPEQFLSNIPPTEPSLQLFQEQLGNVSHKIYKVPGQPSVEAEWEVPPGHYFMMGDNRDNSNDSRYWGFVPEENIVGKAFFVWFHWEGLFSILNSFSNNGRIN
ncbi:signal peptidase I [Pokkaliibacter sp. MBI-7]|uniref:signal peptidase I n=1 Tax=Pokkaliibacter TaxID=2301194 RepID=UPI001A9C7D5D|nr:MULTISPECIES: signal peptidase I [Pokkaliibacter]MDH2431938.1 signal peptidase I [Pokkaliibacter sp. MBI-7]